jgi:hypothetical protein
MHCGLPFEGLSSGEVGTVRCRFDVVPGPHERNVIGRSARKEMRGASDQCRHVGLCDDVLCGFTFLMVAARGYEHARVVGQMSHKLARSE